MKIYNGEQAILGRLAAEAAKQILLGEEVRIVNCEKVVISGQKRGIFAREKQRRERKAYPLKSMTLSRLPHLFVRRVVRGMIPWRQSRGREAYPKVRCYSGVPPELVGKQMIVLEKASAQKLPTLNYTTVGELCRALGAAS